MRALAILAFLVVVMLAGGAFTARILPDAPTIIQTTDPNASVFAATPEQANQLFFWVIFVVVNVVGAGLTLAGLIWLGSRSVDAARRQPNAGVALATTEDKTE